MVLIIGSTGYLGREAARQMLAHGIAVRAMARTPEKAADLQGLGAQVVQGDLLNPESLARACEGVQQVFAAAHSLIGTGRNRSEHVDGRGHRALIDTAKKSGVQHFVYTSVLDASPAHPIDFWRTKFETEEYLKQSGLSYTILRPSAFVEWHAHNFLGKGILEKGKTSIMGRGETPVNFIAVEDVARFAIAALTDSKAKNRILEIGGPENLTRNQVAAIYGTVCNKQPKVSYMPIGMLKLFAPMVNVLHPGIGRILRLNIHGEQANQSFDGTPVAAEFGIPLTRLEDFAKRQWDGLLKP